MTEQLFEVSVWDSTGHLVHKDWEATAAEVEKIRERYEDHPGIIVNVETTASPNG